MIRKIISGGQTGADRAALDVAIKLGIPHGGWLPEGWVAEDGPVPDKDQLQELPTHSGPTGAERNVIDSDGTLIVCQGSLHDGSDHSRKIAIRKGRPWFQIVPYRAGVHMTSVMVTNWIYNNKIEILNVTGPRTRRDSAMYRYVSIILEQTHALLFFREERPELFIFGQIKSDSIGGMRRSKTVDEAIEQVLAGMSLREKVKLANLQETKLLIASQLLRYLVETRVGNSGVNVPLLEECKARFGKQVLDEFEAAEALVHELWLRLSQTYRLRIVK